MSPLTVYHAGEPGAVEAQIRQGQGLVWSTDPRNWLGSGIYFWEDFSWAEWWALRSLERGEGPRAILAAEIDTGDLLDLNNRHDALAFRTEADLVLEQLQRTQPGLSNHKDSQNFALDAQIANAVQKSIFGVNGKVGLRASFYLGEPLAPGGNFYTGQHLQICLWDATVLQNLRRQSLPDQLGLGGAG